MAPDVPYFMVGRPAGDTHTALAVVTVDRPGARNALDADTVREFHVALDELGSAVRVLIVTGAGDQVFVAGADVRTLLARTSRDVLAAANNRLFARIEALLGV